MTATPQLDVGKALGTDYLLLRSELTKEETDYLERTRRFVEEEVLPESGAVPNMRASIRSYRVRSALKATK
jgi:hypothetical protein